MTGILILEQALNGLQFGLMLFLLAALLVFPFLAPPIGGDSKQLAAEPGLWHRYLGV